MMITMKTDLNLWDALCFFTGFWRNGWDMSWSGFDAVSRCDTALGLAQSNRCIWWCVCLQQFWFRLQLTAECTREALWT